MKECSKGNGRGKKNYHIAHLQRISSTRSSDKWQFRMAMLTSVTNSSVPPCLQDRIEVGKNPTKSRSPFCSFQIIVFLLEFSNVFLKLLFNSSCLCQVIFQCRDLPVSFRMLHFNLFLLKGKSNSTSGT